MALAAVGAFVLWDRPGAEHAAYVRQANEICAELHEAESKFGSPETLPEIATFLDQTAPLAERARDQLKELNPPASTEDAHRALLTRFDESLRLSKEARAAALRGDEERVQEIFGEVNEMAEPLNSKIQEHEELEECLPEPEPH